MPAGLALAARRAWRPSQGTHTRAATTNQGVFAERCSGSEPCVTNTNRVEGGVRRIMGSLALCLALSVTGTGAARASDQIFLRLDGLAGEVMYTGYAGWSEAIGFNVGHGLASSAGPVRARHLTVTKLVDRSSTGLAAAAATGTHIRNAVLDLVRRCTQCAVALIRQSRRRQLRVGASG